MASARTSSNVFKWLWNRQCRRFKVRVNTTLLYKDIPVNQYIRTLHSRYGWKKDNV